MLHRSMLELDNARLCKRAKERASLLVENVAFAESAKAGRGRDTEVVAQSRAETLVYTFPKWVRPASCSALLSFPVSMLAGFDAR